VVSLAPFYSVLGILPFFVKANLLNQTYKNMEMVIGDDCSPNLGEHLELIRTLVGIENLTIFTLTERIPWSLPDIINVGMGMFPSDIILLNGSDSIMFPDGAEKHVSIQVNRGAALIEGQGYLSSKFEETQIFNNPDLINKIQYRNRHHPGHVYSDDYCCMVPSCQECDVLFCNASIPTEIFVDKLGGFRTEFNGLYGCLDTETNYRLYYSGVPRRRSVLPRSVVIASGGVGKDLAPKDPTEARKLLQKYQTEMASYKVGEYRPELKSTPRERNFKYIIRSGKWML
jgi:hypothetical protein